VLVFAAVAVLVLAFAAVAALAPVFFVVFLAGACFVGAFCSALLTVAFFDVGVDFRVVARLLGAAACLLVLETLDFLVGAAFLVDAAVLVVADFAARGVAFLVVARAMTSPLSKQNRVAAATQRAERICLTTAGGNCSVRLVAKFFEIPQQPREAPRKPR